MDKEKKIITKEEILRLQETCMEKVKEEQLYKLRNEAKLRASTTSQTYEEFK